MSSSKFFPPLVVGALKPSITFILLPSLPLTLSCSLFLPLLPLAPLAPLLLTLLPLNSPSHSPCSLSPLAPTEVVGTPKHSITYPYPTLAIASKRGQEGVRGVRGSEGSEGSEREWEEQEEAREVRGSERSKGSEREWATWWNFHYLMFYILTQVH